MSEVALVPVSDQRPLDELASEANAAHERAYWAAGEFMKHFLIAAKALLAARQQMTAREWPEWLQANCRFSYEHANNYVRAGRYADVLGQKEFTTGVQAMTYLRGLPPAFPAGPPPPSDELLAQARALKAEGMLQKEIARIFGVSPQTIQMWLDPEAKQHRRNYVANLNRRTRERNRRNRERQRAAALRKLGARNDLLGDAYAFAINDLERAEGTLVAAYEQFKDRRVAREFRRCAEETVALRERIIRAALALEEQ